MNEPMPDALMVLCHSDGRIATADREAISLLNGAGLEAGSLTVSQIAAKADCAQLGAMFERFVSGEQASAGSVANCGGQACQVLLRRLNGFQSQPLIAIELKRIGQQHSGPAGPAGQVEQDQAMLLEVGRATSRLIHDFKNQMSGLKLYAAYLKKRFAGQPEGVEIAEKIVQSLNEMTENASLIGKLARPVELRLLEEDFTVLVKQAVCDSQPHAAAREVEIAAKLANEVPHLLLDALQIRSALNSLLAQAIESSPVGGTVVVTLEASETELLLSISGEGEALGEGQRQSFFDFLTHERLNKTSLGLALARRVIEAHGGSAEAVAAGPTGREIIVKFRI